MGWYTCDRCGQDYDDKSSVEHECEIDRVARLAEEASSEAEENADRIARLEERVAALEAAATQMKMEHDTQCTAELDSTTRCQRPKGHESPHRHSIPGSFETTWRVEPVDAGAKS